MIHLLMGAALFLPMDQKIVKPGFGKRVVIKTQASLTQNEEPGEFQIRVFKNNEGGAPGDSVKNVRIMPNTLFLREENPTRVTLSIDSRGLESGPLWICITEKEHSPSRFSSVGARLRVRTQSCYQRILQTRN